jgi:hypothetical protein
MVFMKVTQLCEYFIFSAHTDDCVLTIIFNGQELQLEGMFSLDQLCQTTFCDLITYHRFDIYTGY